MSIVLRTTSLYRLGRPGDTESAPLHGAALCVEAGETVAVVGPSDAGTSTLLLCLAGMVDPDGGVISVAGHRLSCRPEAEKAAVRAAYIGLALPSHRLDPGLTIQQSIDLRRRSALRRARRREQNDLLAALRIGHLAATYPSQLRGGELTRAAVAIALANRPRVLLAEEPTRDLTAADEAAVIALLTDRAAAGLAIVVASSSPAVLRAADRVLTLVNGSFRR
ncbi:MAG: transporter related protein [Pseudonocardiales bacterium]|nr:transporter related protein [Jatrophihabitantaceae bacterium]MCW2602395.1 transporter related protein [Pseudonocardiales bacterium]